MGYNAQDSFVRVDRFKPNGKWYDTFAIDMGEFYNDPFIHDALKKAIIGAGVNIDGYRIVCLEPYHKYAHPVMLSDHLRGEK